MAKKSTKKTEIEKQIEIAENSENKIDVSELNVSLEDADKSVENVKMTIETNLEENFQKIVEDAITELQPLKEVTEEIANLGTSSEELNKKLATASVDEVTNYINDEIKKVEALQEKIEKINEKPKNTTGFASITNWWNGMGYDM